MPGGQAATIGGASADSLKNQEIEGLKITSEKGAIWSTTLQISGSRRPGALLRPFGRLRRAALRGQPGHADGRYVDTERTYDVISGRSVDTKRQSRNSSARSVETKHSLHDINARSVDTKLLPITSIFVEHL